MAKSNAVKRLERILADEDYGPKLARMTRKNEAYILDLIDKNRGRDARKEILRLDAERLARRRSRTPTIENIRAKAYARLRRMLNGRPKTVQKGVDHMTDNELSFAMTASEDQLRAKGKLKPIAYPDLDVEWNVFWYR